MRLHKPNHCNNNSNYYYSDSVATHRSKSGLYCARLCRNADYKSSLCTRDLII